MILGGHLRPPSATSGTSDHVPQLFGGSSSAGWFGWVWVGVQTIVFFFSKSGERENNLLSGQILEGNQGLFSKNCRGEYLIFNIKVGKGEPPPLILQQQLNDALNVH